MLMSTIVEVTTGRQRKRFVKIVPRILTKEMRGAGPQCQKRITDGNKY